MRVRTYPVADRAYLRLNVCSWSGGLRVELVGHGNVISRQVEQVAAPAFVVLPPGSFGEFDGVAAIGFCAPIDGGEEQFDFDGGRSGDRQRCKIILVIYQGLIRKIGGRGEIRTHEGARAPCRFSRPVP